MQIGEKGLCGRSVTCKWDEKNVTDMMGENVSCGWYGVLSMLEF